jgi:hypothetical protein
MKRFITILAICSTVIAVNAQSVLINKQLKDFPDTFNLSTPLYAGITCSYLIVNGKENRWRDASVYMTREYLPKSNALDRKIKETTKKRMLNSQIKEVIIYKDSVACMITQIDSASYSIRTLGFEDGKWLNIGEDMRRDIESSREVFSANASNTLNRLRRSLLLKSIPTDTLAFVDYLEHHGTEPREFLLETMATHSLVIYGELHRRKISWDFLTSVLQDPRFPEKVGTVFLELPSYQQSEFDRFYTSKKLDTELLLEILRSQQIYGWWDRGEYEFLINVWKLNQTLPPKKRIKVVPVDEQIPYKTIKTAEDYKKSEANLIDRNTAMANVVEKTLQIKLDKRNSLFVVGYGHAFKSHVPGGYSTPEGQEPALSAGAQLIQRLSDKNVFVILQHVPMGTNTGALGFIRHGLFDKVFEKSGNKPIAFRLGGSPFGAEPFDADYEMSFDSRVGNFADNFDGYIFLKPLKDEDSEYVLYDIWSDKFVDEMKRRATLSDFNMNRWLGNEGELTKEKIISTFKEECEGKKRWSQLFE